MKFVVHFLINIVSTLIAVLPIRVQFFLGDLIGYLWFDVLRIRRRSAIENLNRCFPDWNEEKKIQVARASVCGIGRSFIEFLRIPSIENFMTLRHMYDPKFEVRGVEHLAAALKKGRGVFLLTAHIGNGDWATVGLALRNIKLHIISKRIKPEWLNRFWFETRESIGSEFISDRGTSLAILRLLKKNQIVVYMLDQFMGPPIGIRTTFFGHETGTPVGLALLAERSGAAVLPTFTYREPDGRTCVVFEPEIPFEDAGNKEETHTRMTQRYCDVIEQWVRRYPEQWMWVHRRWKKYKY